MQQGRIRPIAIAIILRGDDIFVAEGYDSVKHETFYRPLGGSIEFGEYSRQTVERELREELNAQVTVGRSLGALENVFACNGETGHEIVLMHEAEFTDPVFYTRESFVAAEDDASPFRAVWKPLSFFRAGKAPLYPDGLLELLAEKQQ